MPYPLAHPAAVIPLVRPLGRFAVPSALVIGSMAPDFWYFVPLLTRHDTHSAAGLLWFCLPAGLAAYAAFHLLVKQPLLALLPRSLAARLAAFTSEGLPAAPWHAVCLSLLVGGATHYAWDSFTHYDGAIVQALPVLQAKLFALGKYSVHVHQLLQHASTVLGTAFVSWWVWRRSRSAAPAAMPPVLSPSVRAWIIAALAAACAAWAAWAVAYAALPFSFDLLGLRRVLRSAGLAAVEALGVALLAYCIFWQLHARRVKLS